MASARLFKRSKLLRIVAFPIEQPVTVFTIAAMLLVLWVFISPALQSEQSVPKDMQRIMNTARTLRSVTASIELSGWEYYENGSAFCGYKGVSKSFTADRINKQWGLPGVKITSTVRDFTLFYPGTDQQANVGDDYEIYVERSYNMERAICKLTRYDSERNVRAEKILWNLILHETSVAESL